MQSALVQWTGLRTVPNVFIGGKHTGGCDSKSLLFLVIALSALLMFSFLQF
uniref:Glutaredoxin n=1 Tax=Rhizophora mucronata TaxID=61149 RepID=A0A2P2JP34_RHIMU